jgi:hypothetical protein
MKLKYFGLLVLQLLGKTLSQQQNVKCSQLDFWYYDSVCCNSANDVTCLKQISQIDYDNTIDNLQNQINAISTGNLEIRGESKVLSIEAGASMAVVSDSAATPSSIQVKENSKLVMEADSVLDVSAVQVSMGATQDLRTLIDFARLGHVTGKDDQIVLDSVLKADKGLSVDGDRFVVADVSGTVTTKGDVVAWGEVNSGTLNVNDKLLVDVSGKVSSKGVMQLENELHVKNGAETKFVVKQDGSVEAKGKVLAQAGLDVSGQVANLAQGISVNNLLTVDAVGNTVIKGKLEAKEGGIIGGAGKNTELQGTTTVPDGSSLVVNGLLNVINGDLQTSGSVTANTITIDAVVGDIDFQSNKLLNAAVQGSLDGSVGATTPSTVAATTISSSGLATLHSVAVSNDATLGSISVSGNAITGVDSLTAASIVTTTEVTVGGNAVISGTLSAVGASTLDAVEAGSLQVNGATTLKGAASMENDVTFEKNIIVKEKMQIGLGTTVVTPSTLTKNEDQQKCSISYTLFDGVAGYTGIMCNSDLPAFDSASYANAGECLAAAAQTCSAYLDAREGYACIHNYDVTDAPDAATCAANGHSWELIGIDDSGVIVHIGVSQYDLNCRLCASTGTAVQNNNFATQPFYAYTAGSTTTSGAVDFAKDGTLQTSGKATLASLEVSGATSVADITSSGVVQLTTMQTSSESFKVISTGDVTAKDILLTGDASVQGAVDLLSSLKVVGEATVQSALKTVDASDAQNPVDGVVLGTDGSVSAKSMSVDGPISGKDNLFAVTDAGAVQATQVNVDGHHLPMFQESRSPKCEKGDGVIMFAEGACSHVFRKWECADGQFTGQDESSAEIGQCNGAITASYVTASDTADVCNIHGTQATQFCEALDTRAQCEGTPKIGPNGASVGAQDAKTWTPVGSVILRLCQDGSLINLPSS